MKYIFEDKAECEEVVRNFPRKVMTNAPGITISQAVVELGNDFVKSVNELEGKLRSQRNKPCKSITVGRLGISRSPQTGLPITKLDEGKEYDASTYAKIKHNKVVKLCQKSFGEKVDLKSSSIPFDAVYRSFWDRPAIFVIPTCPHYTPLSRAFSIHQLGLF